MNSCIDKDIFFVYLQMKALEERRRGEEVGHKNHDESNIIDNKVVSLIILDVSRI